MTAIDNIRKALVAVADCTSISGIEGAMCGLYAVTTTDKLAEVLAHIDAQQAEIERLKRGEFICQKCGLRKDADHPVTHDF